MNRFTVAAHPLAARALVTLIVTSIVAGCAGVGGSVPSASIGPMAPTSPEPSAVPAPLTQRFISTLNGISMDYPVGWQTRPATEPWTDGVLGFDAAGVDIIFDPARGGDLYFALASEPLRGRSDDAWGRSLTLPNCPGGHGGGVVTLDGATGWVVDCGRAPLGSRYSALLVTATRGYAIVLYVGEGLAETYSHDMFHAALETLELE